jgi:hypothetical protein
MIHITTREYLNVLITAKAFSVPVFGWFLRTISEHRTRRPKLAALSI